jgi:hypothetical protein
MEQPVSAGLRRARWSLAIRSPIWSAATCRRFSFMPHYSSRTKSGDESPHSKCCAASQRMAPEERHQGAKLDAAPPELITLSILTINIGLLRSQRNGQTLERRPEAGAPRWRSRFYRDFRLRYWTLGSPWKSASCVHRIAPCARAVARMTLSAIGS